MKQFEDYLIPVVNKLCQLVGIQPQTLTYFQKNEWYLKHSWTEKQEDTFRKWFINYLQDKEARTHLMNHPQKRFIKRAVDNFIFNYGWKNK